MRAVEHDLAGPVTAATVTAWAEAALDAWWRTRDALLELSLDLGAELSDAQVVHFVDELEDRQTGYRRKYLGRSEAEYRDDSRAALTETLEDFLGRLEPAQREQVSAAVARLERFDGHWLAERRLWLDRLRGLLERRPGWQDAVRAAVTGRAAARPPAYRAAFDHNLAVFTGVIAAVLNGRSEAQAARLARELGALRADLERLAAQR